MDHRGSTHLHDHRLPRTIVTSCGALEGAAHSQQSLRRLVRRRAQLPWAQVRAGRIRRRTGGAVSRFQSEVGALEWRGRWHGTDETVRSDQDGYGNEAAFADAASGKGRVGVEEAIAELSHASIRTLALHSRSAAYIAPYVTVKFESLSRPLYVCSFSTLPRYSLFA